MPVTLHTIGDPEIVFDWTTDRCDDLDIPDTTADAFVDADGNVQLIATHQNNRRMIGPTLDTIKRDCQVVFESSADPNPAAYNGYEWVAAVYTEDGETVYALIHDEFQGQRYEGVCPGGDWRTCWMNVITLAVSKDGGKTYQQADSPDHYVAGLPFQYEPGIGPSGLFAPSEIVHNESDSYYYSLLYMEHGPRKLGGICAIRTESFADPKSWRAWDGRGFNIEFVDPYTTTDVVAAEHICKPVALGEIGGMEGGLSYNSYLDKFILVGVNSRGDDLLTGETVFGVYYSLSDDLVNWSPTQLLAEVPTIWAPGPFVDRVAYPTLLDPSDSSRNFEVTGRTPYLYYTVFHNSGLDRDLVRIRVDLGRVKAESTSWDFTERLHGWSKGQFSKISSTDQGLLLVSAGSDPLLISPPVYVGESTSLRVTLRMRSEATGPGQLYYSATTSGFTEGDSRSFFVRHDGGWHDYSIVVPVTGPKMVIRVDPATGPGSIEIAEITIEGFS